MILEIKKGSDLNSEEIKQIKEALFREFRIDLKQQDKSADKLFFLLKQGEEIFAMGALWKVQPVIFAGENHTFFAVLNVIANKKGSGYGKKVVSAMKDYLIKNDLIGLGFCAPKNQGFYQKCGFSITTNSTQRFIYEKNGKQITNQDGQVIFYHDSSENFMKKVLAEPKKNILIPTDGLW